MLFSSFSKLTWNVSSKVSSEHLKGALQLAGQYGNGAMIIKLEDNTIIVVEMVT